MIQTILDQKVQLERPTTRNKDRQHLSLADKLRIIYLRSRGVTEKAIKNQFGICYRNIDRIESPKERLLSMDTNNVPLSLQRCTAPKHPEIDAQVIQFISFARTQRLTVSMKLIRERARITAEELNITSFKASPGWLQKFLRRSPVQPSFKIHGEGKDAAP